MAFDFSTLVTDRTQQDVAYAKQLIDKLVTGTATDAEKAEWNSFTLKGSYNHTDLNRVTAAMEDLKLRLEGYGYAVPGYQRIKVPHPVTGGGSKLPEGYTELAWIESTGTQYIDTGFKPNQTTRVEIEVDVTTNTTSTLGVLGCRVTTGGNYFALWEIDGVFKWQYEKQTISSGVTAYGRHTVIVDKSGIMVDGSLSSATEGTISCNYNVLLFAVGTGGTADSRMVSAKFYSCRIYDNGILVRDYIPCINPDGEVGLYDLVTATFFGNSGTGAFIAGAIPRELPKGYTQVEYIQSSGTQYIDSGVTVSSVTIKGLRVVADFNFVTVSGTNFLGISDSNAVFWFGTFGGNIWYSDGVNSLQTGVAYDGKRRVFDLDAKNGTFTVRGTSVSVSGISINNPSGSGKFLLPAGGSGFVLYSCQMYDNDVLVRDFVPCKNSGGVVGLYDLANDVFYQNAGSGTFAAGEEVVASATASVMVASSDLNEYDPYTWYEFDWPTPEAMTMYLLNVAAIRTVLSVLQSTPRVPPDMEKLMVKEANDIEQIVLDVYRQITIMSTTFIACGEALCGGDNL